MRVAGMTPPAAPPNGGSAAGARRGGVPPQASPRPTLSAREALRELARWRDRNYAHACWIADGYPTLTEAAHAARFGTPYVPTRSRKASA